MGANIRVGALISGGGTNLQAILDACAKGDIPAEVVFVGTDNPQAAGLKRAQKSHIATFCVDYRQIIRAVRQAPYDVSLPAGVDLDELLAKQKLFITDSPEKRNGIHHFTGGRRGRFAGGHAAIRFRSAGFGRFHAQSVAFFDRPGECRC